MIYIGVRAVEDWMLVDYNTTWTYGYDFILDAVQWLIDSDFEGRPLRIAVRQKGDTEVKEKLDEVSACGNILRNCKSVSEEHELMMVTGISKALGCMIQLNFFNQTNYAGLYHHYDQCFQENALDNYMNSIEILAYCRDAERKAIERFRSNSDNGSNVNNSDNNGSNKGNP